MYYNVDITPKWLTPTIYIICYIYSDSSKVQQH